MVFKHNRKQHILAIVVAFFAAVPAICLPIGVRAGASAGLTVANAHAAVFGEDDEDDDVTIEDWALVGSDDEMEDSETGEDPDKIASAQIDDEMKRAEIKKLIQETETDTTKYLYAMGQKFKKEFKSVDAMSGSELDYALMRIQEKKKGI